MKTIAIIGGGASGLAAAISAGQDIVEGGLANDVRVVLYEADEERVGRSVLATGNGRCNFSNARIDPALYRNGRFVAEALRSLAADEATRGEASPALPHSEYPSGCAHHVNNKYPVENPEAPVWRFFSDLGLMWREESEGRLYPLANKASSVVDVLRAGVRAYGVRERFGCALSRIDAPAQAGQRFHLRFRDGSIEHADAVVVAVGGRASAAVELPPDISREPVRPVLGPLRADPRIARQLNNIRVKCSASLMREGTLIACERGELLFRDYGVSGVCVFNLSRFANEGDVLSIDLLPQVPSDERESWLFARRKRLGAIFGQADLSAEETLRGAVLPQVARVACKCAGLDPDKPLQKRDVPELARVLGALRLAVQGVGDAKQCQVARGGVCVSALDARTMEAQGHPALYVSGEAIDVDAPCGGYNLHWAWASGIIAGRAAVRALANL